MSDISIFCNHCGNKFVSIREYSAGEENLFCGSCAISVTVQTKTAGQSKPNTRCTCKK